MCSIDDAEPWTVYSQTERRARKDHRCCDCGRIIAKGERHTYATGLMEDSWYEYRACAHCMAAAGWLMRMCNGWMWEHVGEELGDHWREGYRNVALGRLIILHRRDWRGVTPEQVAAWAKESVDRIERRVAA